MESSVATQSRKIILHNSKETPHLLEEIITEEILPRLPVKSLLKFRCVAKSWCSLIASKKFMKAHLKNSIKSSSFAHHMILFDNVDGFKQFSLPSLFNEPLTYPITYDADLGINFKRDSIYIVGCCNGLVCILIDEKRLGERFILWNPATKKVNNFDNKIKRGTITKYGFGFDELNDDYKIFGIRSFSRAIGVYVEICKVYSLNSDSWEVIEGRDASLFGEAGTYVSGKLHWDNRDAHICEIVSFDLSSYVYGVIELPSYLKNESPRRLGLAVLKGCLSVHCFHLQTHLDIWLMKEYGVKESWDKVTTVPYYHGPHDYLFTTPVVVFSNGEVLLICKGTFMIYDPKGNVFRHPRITDDEILNSAIYIESLASVDPYAEQDSQLPRVMRKIRIIS